MFDWLGDILSGLGDALSVVFEGIGADIAVDIWNALVEWIYTISQLNSLIIQSRPVMLEMISLDKEQIESHKRSTTLSKVAKTS